MKYPFHSLFLPSLSSPQSIANFFLSYEKMGNLSSSLEWFNILISVAPTDPGILARLGELFVKTGDRAQAFQYFSEVNRESKGKQKNFCEIIMIHSLIESHSLLFCAMSSTFPLYSVLVSSIFTIQLRGTLLAWSILCGYGSIRVSHSIL